MRENAAKSSSAGCNHTPTTVSVIPTKHGYRVRCLRCGTIGPEREDPARAWAALRGWRNSKSTTTREGDDRHEEEDTPDLRAGPPDEVASSEA